MTTATLERVTTAEFLARADQDDYELIDGELKERCMGMEAAWVATQFATRLTNFNNEHRLGTVVGDNTPLQIFGERQTIPRPDGLFVSVERHPSRAPVVGALRVTPELVIEVVSPSDNAAELMTKVLRYLDAGVDMVWVVYPESRSVHVIRADLTGNVIRPPMNLDGGNILPGFSHPVADFFPAPVPE